MYSPAAESDSYTYMSRSDGVCPVKFLRWSWQAILGLNTTDEYLGVGPDHHKSLWTSSQWYKDPEWRAFVDPINAGDKTLRNCCSFPFVVACSKGDPLHDESIALIELLKKSSARVIEVDTIGNHVAAYMVHQDAKERLQKAWRSIIFEKESNC